MANVIRKSARLGAPLNGLAILGVLIKPGGGKRRIDILARP